MEVDSIIDTPNSPENTVTAVEKLFAQETLVELSRSSWHPSYGNYIKTVDKQTYCRGCKWSPDGTCCLTIVNNGGQHLLELPKDLYQVTNVGEDRPVDILSSVVRVPESGLVYDFCWYPAMNSYVPESCCWLTTRQHGPIQMWDAFDGALRCSYRGFNNVDELEAAISVCFSSDGTQIHGGYKKCLKTFRTDRPGREYVNQPISGSAASLACSNQEDLISVGSWRTEISLYHIQDGTTKAIGKMKGHSGGVTHLKFLPDGTKLVSGARKDSKLLVWDIRHYKNPFKTLHRRVNTNQRIYFDISPCGKYLISGGTDGVVSVWDLSEENDESNKQTMFPLHNDCCNGVAIHPYRPIMATSSGQHHLFHGNTSEDEMENNSGRKDNEISSPNQNAFHPNYKSVTARKIENSLQFWWTGECKVNDEK